MQDLQVDTKLTACFSLEKLGINAVYPPMYATNHSTSLVNSSLPLTRDSNLTTSLNNVK